MYLDACYDEEDDDEREAFENSMARLSELVQKFPGMETSSVNEKACRQLKKHLIVGSCCLLVPW